MVGRHRGQDRGLGVAAFAGLPPLAFNGFGGWVEKSGFPEQGYCYPATEFHGSTVGAVATKERI